MENVPLDKKVILFDGVCNMCDATVQFVYKKDKKDIFRFVSLQSDLGQKILSYLGIDRSKTDSIVFYEPGKAYYYKSSAALRIAANLGGIYALAMVFYIFPAFLRDAIYDFVARNRYKWFGKKDSCAMPTKELRDKFLAM